MTFDSIRLESVSDTEKYKKGKPSPYSLLATAHAKNGGSHLIIRLNTHKQNLKEINNLVKKANKKNVVAPKNVRESVMHEFGHVMHNKLKHKNPKVYNQLNKDLDSLYATKGKKVKVSQYSAKSYKATQKHNEQIAESMVYILSNRRPRNGHDTIKTVRSAFTKAGMIKSNRTKPKRVERGTPINKNNTSYESRLNSFMKYAMDRQRKK